MTLAELSLSLYSSISPGMFSSIVYATFHYTLPPFSPLDVSLAL